MRIITIEGQRPTVYVRHRDWNSAWRESPVEFKSQAQAVHYAKRLEPLVHRVEVIVVKQAVAA